ncbi:MAG: preprotein translocase subunit SecE [Planctomycetota bacterium]|nr:preprotein translocase subunit SecE [Planctomycetota bacterium]
MYKAGQGMPSRIGAVVVGLIIAVYASMSWYAWLRPVGAATRFDAYFSVGFIGAFVLLIGVLGLFYWLAFRSRGSADYLIDMDDELRKVVWPSVMPLFDAKTEAWGSTYVVIVCAIFFTIFIWLVDVFLQLTISYGLFQKLLFA